MNPRYFVVLDPASPILNAQPRAAGRSGGRRCPPGHRENNWNPLPSFERKVMVTMSGRQAHGPRTFTGPKIRPNSIRIIFVRTPYNFNYWDVRHRWLRAI